MNEYQIIILIIVFALVFYILSEVGAPNGKEILYYFVIGIVFVFIAVVISTFEGDDISDVLFLKNITVSIVLPLGLGYPLLIVGIVGIFDSIINFMIKKN